ncbi:MAG: hypothetical protein ACREFQ_01255 [Stellaceae bacterium]
MACKTAAAATSVLLALTAAPACAAAPELRIDVIAQSGIAQPILYDRAPTPTANLILFIGGDGDLAHQDNSFLVRVRHAFVAAGLSVAVPDTPSDHPGGFGPYFRTWTANTNDIAAVIAFLKKQSPAPVWAVGVSNGTISAASVAAHLGPHQIAGLALTSAVWLGGLGLVPVAKIAVPVLEVQNRNDACPAAKFDLAKADLARFSDAPEKRFIAVSSPPGGEPCGSKSPHDFWGVEDQVVAAIIAWIEAPRPVR